MADLGEGLEGPGLRAPAPPWLPVLGFTLRPGLSEARWADKNWRGLELRLRKTINLRLSQNGK